jgi:hypothetical protein
MINVLLSHDHTSGGKPCGVRTSMNMEELNYVVAWLQSALDDIEMGTPLIECDCAQILCDFYGCTLISEDWQQELNLSTNWDTYLCGPLSKKRKPFVDKCENEGAFLALKKLAVEMEKCRIK